MTLRQIAHARAGDKGNISNIAIFVYDPANYPMILNYLTPERVAEHFRDTVEGPVERYELPKLEESISFCTTHCPAELLNRWRWMHTVSA